MTYSLLQNSKSIKSQAQAVAFKKISLFQKEKMQLALQSEFVFNKIYKYSYFYTN